MPLNHATYSLPSPSLTFACSHGRPLEVHLLWQLKAILHLLGSFLADPSMWLRLWLFPEPSSRLTGLFREFKRQWQQAKGLLRALYML